jgi:hypothetical protein
MEVRMKSTGRRVAKRAPGKKDETMPAAKESADQLPEQRNHLSRVCLDASKPPEIRAKILLEVLQSSEEQPAVQHAVLTYLLRQTAAQTPEAELLRLLEGYQQALTELENGPLRPGTFLGAAGGDVPGPNPRVHVVAPDGQEHYPLLHPRVRFPDLRPGMTVFLDPKGSTVLGVVPGLPRVGQQGQFLRLLPATNLVEAVFQTERLLLYAATPVLDALADGKLKSGDRLLVCSRRLVALGVVPAETDYRHRFVDRGRVPDVIAERDIGRPHWVLGHLLRRLRLLLDRPELFGRFDLRPRCAVLLTGPTGCGKTLTIRAFLREFDRLLAERTGRPDLGSRVILVKAAELLSEWLGRSDKNIEALFDDVQAIAATAVETAAGERVRLPVVVILEEIEGLTRRRGEQDATVYDRILTTLLQRLDDSAEGLGELPLILISTSNRPDLIDAALCRRLGLQARFARLDREGLAAVLDKKLKPHYPYAPVAGLPAKQIRTALITQIVTWLFGPGADRHGVVEITLLGGQKITRYRRDFLTGGVVDQAVAGAIDQTVVTAGEAVEAEAGLTAAAVIDALRRQLDTLADNLSATNAADYLDLPENARVASVRRLRDACGYLPSLLTDLKN